ncbi:MAG TPA: DegT/DnrJ/EryC1/StrS family aminotransferase [Candidatus Acidoferrales bacterium]|nr:DegT/DnrJ/EryC1/StrS family aminotransferase [Candidatus Acidoferrales bacterium]
MRDILRINQPMIGKEEIDAVNDVLKSGILSEKSGMGPRILEFEKDFAKFVGAKHAVAVSSGTAALHMALLVAGVKVGDEVVVPSFTFHATAEAVLLAGGEPVFADIDPDTYTLTAETVEAVMTRNTKVILPVHLYGLPADLDPLKKLARERGLTLVEDGAQAHGAEYKDSRIGSVGDMTCFSFYAGKNMTTGEGGMVTTDDDDSSEKLRMLRSHGEQRPYWPTMVGNNYRMTEILAAVGSAQLRKLPSFLEKRKKNARFLGEKVGMLGKVVPPKEPGGRKHSWYLYTLRLRGANAGKRNKVIEKLRSRNIEASVYYESPLHMLPLYRERSTAHRALPETEKACRQVFSLPVHPRLGETELDYVFDTLKRVLT